MIEQLITFNDVLIKPKFSTFASRKDVDISRDFLGYRFSLPILSANMDTITDARMSKALAQSGAVGCLHRFWSIEENVSQYKEAECNPWISVGLGPTELDRAKALFEAGSTHVVVDVANGGSLQVVEQVKHLRQMFKNNAAIIVGNFATSEAIRTFRAYVSADAYKVNIGAGSVCTTRLKTGVGIPQLSAIMDCVSTGEHVIADGGMNEVGDICKSLGAGAQIVMTGKFFSGTEETPGEIENTFVGHPLFTPNGGIAKFKKYRGSASKESYEVQGKIASHRTAEGESTLVPYKGPVSDILADIEGGLRSAMTYVNARNLDEFFENCEFVAVSNSTTTENGTRK